MKQPPQQEYPIGFNENGLGNGTSWSITLEGETRSSKLPDIVFSKPNGRFPFTTNLVLGYASTPSSGSITVSGVEVREAIHFSIPWTSYSATIHPNRQQSISIGFAGNATVNAPTIHIASSNNPHLDFNATEIGPRGLLNVTIPRSIAPLQATVDVAIDGVPDPGAKVSSDAHNYYVSFSFPYGTHSIDLAFNSPPPPYLSYIAIGVLSAGILGTIVLFRNRRTRKRNLS